MMMMATANRIGARHLHGRLADDLLGRTLRVLPSGAQDVLDHHHGAVHDEAESMAPRLMRLPDSPKQPHPGERHQHGQGDGGRHHEAGRGDYQEGEAARR